ncbi:MAG: transcriptional regulator [Promethearchaeia archaeon]
MTSKDVWKTRRQKIIDLLKREREINNLHDLYKEIKYPNKRILIEDILAIMKSLKKEGIKMEYVPPSCAFCGYIFKKTKDRFMKIPSKCPKCKKEKILWPSLKIK